MPRPFWRPVRRRDERNGTRRGERRGFGWSRLERLTADRNTTGFLTVKERWKVNPGPSWGYLSSFFSGPSTSGEGWKTVVSHDVMHSSIRLNSERIGSRPR